MHKKDIKIKREKQIESKPYTITSVSVPQTNQRFYMLIRSASRELVASSGRLDTLKALCMDMGLSRYEVEISL